MTTIAFNGKYLAADRQVIADGSYTINATFPKIKSIHPHPQIWFSFSGIITNGSKIHEYLCSVDAGQLLSWLVDGQMPKQLYRDIKGNDQEFAWPTILLVFQNPKHGTWDALEWDDEGVCYTVPNAGKGYSIGSGQCFALGALGAGASPMDAIRIASRFDLGTGGGVQWVKLGNNKINVSGT